MDRQMIMMGVLAILALSVFYLYKESEKMKQKIDGLNAPCPLAMAKMKMIKKVVTAEPVATTEPVDDSSE